MSYEKLSSIEINLHPLEEQQKIGSFLSSIDVFLKYLNLYKIILNDYKSLIQKKLLDRELKFQIDNSEWKTKKVDELLILRTQRIKGINGETLLIDLDSIESATGKLVNKKIVNEVVGERYSFNNKSILYGKLRPYLKKHYLPFSDGVCSTEFFVLEPYGLDLKFCYALVSSEKFVRESNISFGSKMPRADWSYMSQTKFVVPLKLEEQKKIGELVYLLEKYNHKIDSKIEKINKLRNYYLNLIFK